MKQRQHSKATAPPGTRGAGGGLLTGEQCAKCGEAQPGREHDPHRQLISIEDDKQLAQEQDLGDLCEKAVGEETRQRGGFGGRDVIALK